MYDCWPLPLTGRLVGLAAGAAKLVAAYNRVAMLDQSEDVGRMGRSAKIRPAGILELGDLAKGFEWVACVGESELAHFNKGDFRVEGLGRRSGLRGIICRAATTHAGPFCRLQIERR